ncbi:hypothetical protein, partial [Streptomyces sp. NPDC058953]|uniref:hypothetical protein n=1 Tax=Streptomyces sp. NPDC058953 TaxID=3346676 RepID=UPI0036B6B4ED
MVSRQLWGMSLRSWLILAVFTATLLTLVGLPALTERSERSDRSGRAGSAPEYTPAAPRPDRKLAGGMTARLSRCGMQGDVRPAVRGAGEREGDPALTVLTWVTHDPDPEDADAAAAENGEGVALTVYAALRAGERPLRMAAPLFAGRGTVDVVSPFGAGVSASAGGLDATVVEEGPDARTAEPPVSGVHRIAPGKRLLLKVDVPAQAMCPGLNPLDVIACSSDAGDAPDDACPALTLTFQDPAVRANRA